MNTKKSCCSLPSRHFLFPLAIVLGVIASFSPYPFVFQAAETISTIFINLLKLISLPIIFLAVASTVSGMQELEEIKHLGKQVFKYTLFTTLIAAFIALSLFLLIDPAYNPTHLKSPVLETHTSPTSKGYIDYLLHLIPSNIVQPFSEGNVISVLLLAFIFSLGIINLPGEKRAILHSFFSSLFSATLKVTSLIVQPMPIAVWAFITLFMRDLKQGLPIQSLLLYLSCVLSANFLQAVFVLPTLLKLKRIPILKTLSGMLPALTVAFWSKSSSAALPVAIQCAEEKLYMSKKVTNFSFPLCTTINMNACAAFILTTVLFVSKVYGVQFSTWELIGWVFIATIAAIGNAGVPMGCFFLASALLASMNLPLNLMGVILPFYSIIDMIESAINIWSDSCVTAIVNEEEKRYISKKPQAVTKYYSAM